MKWLEKLLPRRGPHLSAKRAMRDTSTVPTSIFGRPIYRDMNEWKMRTAQLIDDLPFFGQNVLPVTKTSRRRKRGERLSHEEHKRILLSWLAGGSATQVASRVGVSRRSIYNVIHRYIYSPYPTQMMAHWHDLGLIACIVTPGYPGDTETVISQEVVCLICHERIGRYSWDADGLGEGEVFRPDPERQMPPANASQDAQITQGHLIVHFLLEKYPATLREPFFSFWGTNIWSSLGRWTTEYIDLNAPNQATNIYSPYARRGLLSEQHHWRNWRLLVLEGKPPTPPTDL